MNLVREISLSFGWTRRAIALLSGAFGALSLAPVNLFPALVVTFVVSIWLLDGLASAKRGQDPHLGKARLVEAFGIGWWVGFGYFVAGLWWLGAAFLVDAAEFAWALPLGVFGLPAVLACFTGLGFALAHLFWSSGASRILAFSLSLTASEWVRATAFTGFPWNSFGMALGGDVVLAQAASLVGLHGLTLLTILIFASPATLSDDRAMRERAVPSVCALVVFLALLAFGSARLWLNPTVFDASARIRIVQPNVAQDENFRPERREAIIAQYLRASSVATAQFPNGLADVTHVVWPESAFPFFLARDPDALSTIAKGLGAATLITGAARVESLGADGLPGEIRKVSYFNAIQVVGAAEDRILDSYDKVHLVPFGEYLPFSGLLESFGLRQFVQIPGGFDPGSSRKLLNVPGLPKVFPLICYEAIFPGVLDPALRRSAGAIVNVSNDGWFGTTSGPYQHLAQARLRSIEEGLPILRAANTGMSAVIDPYGRFIGRLGLGSEGVVDTELPRAAAPPLFALAPVLAPLGLYLAICVLFLLMRRRSSVEAGRYLFAR